MIDLFKAELLRFRVGHRLRRHPPGRARLPDAAWSTWRSNRDWSTRSSPCVYARAGPVAGPVPDGQLSQARTRGSTCCTGRCRRGRSPRALTRRGRGVAAIGVLLPALVVAGWQEGMTARVVDTRHLLLIVSAWLIARARYLAGAYAMLADRRYAVLRRRVPRACSRPPKRRASARCCCSWPGAWRGWRRWCSSRSSPISAAAPRGVVRTVIVGAPLQVAMWFALRAARLRRGVRVDRAGLASQQPAGAEGRAATRKPRTPKARTCSASGWRTATIPKRRCGANRRAISDVFEVGPEPAHSCPRAAS